MLEDEARNQIRKPLLEGKNDPTSEHTTFCNFVVRPCMVGKDLFTIIKFGLVQYVSPLSRTYFCFILLSLIPSGFSTDDFEDSLCPVSICPGVMWSLWRWRI